MNTKRPTLNIVVIVSLAFSLIVIVVAVGARKWPRAISPGASNPQKGERVTDTLPPVISSISGIEVVSAFIDAHGIANITVINKTNKGITGLAISSGNFMFSDDYGLTQDNPAILIPPNSSYTFQEPVSNLRANHPIQVSAVFYNDGTEDGDTDVRKNIHDARHEQRERRLLQPKKEKGN